MKTKQRRKKGATIVARQQPRRLDNVYPKMKTTKTRKIKKRGQLVSQKGATSVAKGGNHCRKKKFSADGERI